MSAPRGRSRKEGACNEPVEAQSFAGFLYCHRPDNGSGLCNVHEAARKRGEARRKEHVKRLRLLGWPNRRSAR